MIYSKQIGGFYMEHTYLTAVNIVKVRHLHDITIPLSTDKRKHLILTGKNGSGKTSVLEALVNHFHFVVGRFETKEDIQNKIDHYQKRLRLLTNATTETDKQQYLEIKKYLSFCEDRMKYWTTGAVTECTSFSVLQEKYMSGDFILAYYKANRLLEVEVSNIIENIKLKELYKLDETPGKKLIKYMVGLKATQAFAQQKKEFNRAAEIEEWFERFERILKIIFDDPSIKLDFDIDNFEFRILQKNREPFDFNTMSSGYSAVFEIINDLIIRFEGNQTKSKEGIVLIDEIDTHLHLELQRTVLPFLTTLFPNIQFIVTTHSPFILSSIDNAVIFDLETGTLVKDGLSNYPYDGIVESFFDADTLSVDLRNKLERYKELTKKEDLSDEDYAEIIELEQDLDEIPDFLSPKIASDYSCMKLEFSNRGD